MSQTKLADACNVSQGTIGNLESGLRSYGLSIFAIARELGTTPEYLRMEEGAEEVATSSYIQRGTDKRTDHLSERRAHMVADLADMLARFKSPDDLRVAYARCIATLDGFTAELMQRPAPDSVSGAKAGQQPKPKPARHK